MTPEVAVRAAAATLAALAAVSLPHQPQELRPGRDVCAYCQHTVAERGFGGVVVFVDGRQARFDDLGCLLVAVMETEEPIASLWLDDHGGRGLWPMPDAVYVFHPLARTPRDSHLVGFADESEAAAYVERLEAEVTAARQ